MLLLLCLLVVGAPLLLAPLLTARSGAPPARAVAVGGGEVAARPSQALPLPLTRRGGRGVRGKLREGAGKGGSPGARHHKQLKRRAAAAASSTHFKQSVST